jgi:tetratricopeptide (TPR) repeat protein
VPEVTIMNCDQAFLLISADVDHELCDADHARLRRHLDDCSDCRITFEALQHQDAELRQGLGPRRQAVLAVAERVVAQLPRHSTGLLHDPPTEEALRALRWRLGMVMAAAVAALCFGLRFLLPTPHAPEAAPAVALTPKDMMEHGLTARPRQEVAAAKALGIGETVQTSALQRRRVTLSDGSVLYVNQNTRVRIDGQRRVSLLAGEVFLEVAPRTEAPFVVRTTHREMKALGTKFAVQADDAGRAGVVVTQGRVQVNDVAEPLSAGDQLAPDRTQRTPAPRASHLLDWTRELMAAAESPLVPDSKYTGGALVAVDPNGQEAKLSLRKYHVDVHIEDGFARTIIDQTYFNAAWSRMEGTFYFPLPADASLSRLAMYVGENLMEGGMAERDYARNVYEQIVTTQKDPALLEWVEGSTFKMRVFPLEARQEKRILIGYTQRLSSLYGRAQYRFPAGHSLGVVNEWSFRARVKQADGLACQCDSHTLKGGPDGNDLLLEAKEQHCKLDRDLVLELNDRRATPTESARFSRLDHEGQRYLMLRYQPSLPVEKRRQARDWVFLFESSGDRDPVVARVQVDVIRALLANAEHDDTFTILAAGTRVNHFSPTLLPVTPENVKAAVEYLESRQLIGALDLDQALNAAAPLLTGHNPHLVHVGSGVPAMGERRIDQLALRVPAGARYVGVGVGKRWNRDFMKAAAEKSGGYFTQINPDEPVTWRGFELAATLNTPRLMNVHVAGGTARFLTFGNSLAQGEELCAVARLGANEALPARITVTGVLDGQDFRREFAVPAEASPAGHLPRTWAKLEIEHLLADPSADHRAEIVALSKAMYVMTPYTSLLVLENEAMYEQFKVDRGRKDHWAPYPAPAKIPVVYEPEDGKPTIPGQTTPSGKPSAEDVAKTILVRQSPRRVKWVDQSPKAKALRAMYRMQFGLDEQDEAIQRFEGTDEITMSSQSLRHGLGVSFGADTTRFGIMKTRLKERHSSNQGDYQFYTDLSIDEAFSRSMRFDSSRAKLEALAAQYALQRTPVSRFDTVSKSFDEARKKLENALPRANDFELFLENILEAPRSTREVNRGHRYVPMWKNVSTNGYFNGTGRLGELDAALRSSQGEYVLDYYQPARGVVVVSSSRRIHTRIGGGLVGTDPGTSMRLNFAGTAFTPELRYAIELDSASRTSALNSASFGPPVLSKTPDLNWLFLNVQRPSDGGINFVLSHLGHDTRVVDSDRGVLLPQYRAMTIPVRMDQTVTGFSTLGTLVNLNATYAVNGELRTSPLLSGVQVLATGTDTIKPEGTSGIPTRDPLSVSIGRETATNGISFAPVRPIVTLAVTPGDAATITAYLRTGGQITMDARGHSLLQSSTGITLPDLGTPSAARIAHSHSDVGSIFSDLISYAPGLNTSAADVAAVTEAEAVPSPHSKPGHIDADARRLIEQARTGGWRSLNVGDGANAISFDAHGRYVYERRLPLGLREQVVCDGSTLLHLYAELGLGARRSVSRFHRGELLALVPWLLPPAEDLAHGADLKCVNERTVALVPHGAESAVDDTGKPLPYLCVHLIFADGRLAARRLVEMPTNKVHLRETYDPAAGVVTLLDADGKELARHTLKLGDAAEPNLKPDTTPLVVLPLPYRDRSQTFDKNKLDWAWISNANVTWVFEDLPEEVALQLFATELVMPQSSARFIYEHCFAAKGIRKLGFFTALAAAGQRIYDSDDFLRLCRENPQQSLARYLSLHVNPAYRFAQERWGLNLGDSVGEADSFLHRLSVLHDLTLQRELDPDRAFAFVRHNHDNGLGYLILSRLQEQSKDARFQAQVVEAWQRLANQPGLAYVAPYEQARALRRCGRTKEAADLFRRLYRQALAEGVVPPIDDVFRYTLQDEKPGTNGWTTLMSEAADTLLKARRRPAVVALAWQCRQFGSLALADDLLARAVRDPADDVERLSVTLPAVEYLLLTRQDAAASRLLQSLLDHPQFGQSPGLWRLAGRIAEACGDADRSIVCLEKALDREYQDLPPVIDLQQERQDYGRLLEHYEAVASAAGRGRLVVPTDLLARTVRAADRLRALDRDGTLPYQPAARILNALGARDLAWDYLTTPIALKPNEAEPWRGVAEALVQQGARDLADRAFQAAFDAEPTNAQLLWDRAENLRRLGKRSEAKELLRRVADGEWQPRFNGLKSQAGRELERR